MKKIGILLSITIALTTCLSEKSEHNIYALIVSKDGKVVKENYFNGKTENNLMNVQSVTKSIVSILIGIAIDEGYIESEDVPVYTFFPEDSILFDGNKNKITIKHLLNHTSGLSWDGYNEHESFIKSKNPISYVLTKKLVDIPGHIYNYNSGGAHILSAIIEKATGMTTLQFATVKLFQPLGISEIEWNKLNDSIYDGAGFGLSMKPIDLIKIGELMLENGSYKGVNVLSKNWIEKSESNIEKMPTQWGIRNSKHGYGWYSARIQETEIFYAMGYGGQFIFVIPSKKMVIVAMHNSDTPNGIEQQVDFIKDSFPLILNEYDR